VVPALLALILLWIGRLIARKVSVNVERGLNKSPNSEPGLSRFFASIVKYLILIAVIIAVLTVLGINTSSISVMVLGLGAAMAFILQDSLSNLAAGVMLMIFRPFKVGDDIEAGGENGRVTSIALTATRLKTVDNTEVIIANGKIWGGVVKNYSSLGLRRLDMDFGVSYDADIKTAINALTKAAGEHPLVLNDPAPWAKVVTLNESSIDLQLRAWCQAADYKALKVSISQPIKAALDAANIGIPYPHEIKIKDVKDANIVKAKSRAKKLKSNKAKTA
jgi:small conductance mechanosensitive channel